MMSLSLLSLAVFLGTECTMSAPNIIFMLIDDLGWNDLSYHNGSDYASPNIDQLASNALQLNNYYIQHICSPTRSALHCGRYPIHTGLQHSVISPPSPYGLPLNLTLLPQDLKRAGYTNHMIGKWHCGFYMSTYLPTARGYDTFFGYYLGAEDYYYHNRSYDTIHGYDLRNFTTPVAKPNQYSTYLYGNETMRILKHYDDTTDTAHPFFLYLSFQAIHTPLQAPQDIINSFNATITSQNRRVRAAMVTVLDSVIGEIVHFLRYESQTSLWDNLLLILSTDNGGPVNTDSSNFPLRGSKATLWEGGVKGIGFVTGGWLNASRRNTQMNALMHITDWYPTLCDIVGIKPSNASLLDGYSQWSNIQKGETDVYTPRTEILHNIDMQGCHLPVCGAIRMKQYKLVVGQEVIDTANVCRTGWCPLDDVNQNDTTVQCTADGNYNYPNISKLIHNASCPYNGEPCLYDIVNDPCEYYDIKYDHADVYHMLYNRLLYYNATAVEPLNVLFPQNTSAADPQKLGGFWGPWVDDSDKNEL
eukprot:183142_1